MPSSPPDRIASIDAFRGFTMVCMFSFGFGLSYFAASPLIAPIAQQFEHSAWHGMTFWDLIQPFFMFIVGAVMPISFARRWQRGETWTQSLKHTLWRALQLLLCGEVARSIQARHPVLDVINVLAQLAFATPVAFLTLRHGWRLQAAIAAALLFVHWSLYQFGAAPGVTGPWIQDGNIGWYLDGLVLGKTWDGGYATLNCVSSAANVIFGVMAGSLLVNPALDGPRKLPILTACGLAAILAGLALDPVIPIIKKIWTPSFALLSTGCTLLALAFFYWICDLRKQTRWAHWFLIVGANSLFIYLFHEIAAGYLNAAFRRALGLFWQGPGSQFTAAWIVIAIQFAICWELWRRRLFIRI